MDLDFFNYYIILPWIGLGIFTFILLFFISAPYGRHTRKGWGLSIPPRLGWVVMELVSPAMLLYFFLSGPQEKSMVMWIFIGFWLFHYTNRTFIFPFRMKTKGKRMPLLIPLMAIFFNSVNGFINGYYLGYLSGTYPDSWMQDPRFILGALMFVTGFLINVQADEILLNLRKPGETGYKIPQGGLYSYISNPNYFGEIIEWLGFAVMTWSPSGLAFAIWTAANLAPRAFSNHRWYLEKFRDYPRQRKALIPFVI